MKKLARTRSVAAVFRASDETAKYLALNLENYQGGAVLSRNGRIAV